MNHYEKRLMNETKKKLVSRLLDGDKLIRELQAEVKRQIERLTGYEDQEEDVERS
jgi:hypothetical protein